MPNKEGVLSEMGAVEVNTGMFTSGRYPKVRFIIQDEITSGKVNRGDIDKPVEPVVFQNLLNKVQDGLNNKTIYVRDAYVSAYVPNRSHR